MALIFALALAAILLLFIIFNNENVINTVIIPFLLTMGIIILLIFHLGTPKAIDVYKGRTTLEITYKDKVPIDTTVIWKNR